MYNIHLLIYTCMAMFIRVLHVFFPSSKTFLFYIHNYQPTKIKKINMLINGDAVFIAGVDRC